MPGAPHFFVDRSLGRIRVPGRLRAAGWELTTLAEHYGIPADEDITDIEWLTLAGTLGWAVLMKDDRIRRRPAELAALKAAGVHAFCIANANLDTDHQVEILLHHQNRIFQRCTQPGPTLDSLSKTGMRPIDL
jgi:hypothetical protein